MRNWPVKFGEEHHAREMTRAPRLFRLRRLVPATVSLQVLDASVPMTTTIKHYTRTRVP
jgi:hypothetical protein